ncbi:MAG TPA: hypothetical protein PLU35_01195 [Phycisphaerales bacterium]|nr:hypothetical protein [Phycisphaerales bacterium]
MAHPHFYGAMGVAFFAFAIEHAAGQHDVGTLPWWKQSWREASEWAPTNPILVTYESRVPAAVVRRGLEQWEEALAAGPPEGFESNADMLRERRALVESGKDDIVIWRLWLGKDKHRWTLDRPSTPSQPFSDHGFSGRLTWTLQEVGGQHRVSVVAPSSVTELGEEASIAGASDRARKYLFFGGIGLGAGSVVQRTPSGASQQSSGRWEAEATARVGERRMVWKYVGGTDAGSGRALPESLDMLQVSPSEERYGGARFDDWRLCEVAGTWMANRIDILDASGEIRARWRIVSVEPVSQDRLEELTRLPERDGVDALRGEIRIASLTDYRPEVRQASRAMPDGSVLTWAIDGASRAEDRAWLRVAGWTTLSVLSGVIVLLVWRRYRIGA